MKKLGYIFLILCNVILGVFVLFLYFIGLRGCFTSHAFEGVAGGAICASLYIVFVCAQLYYFLRNEMDQSYRIAFLGCSTVVLLLFIAVSVRPIYNVYKSDEAVHPNPFVKRYEYQPNTSGVKWDKKGDAERFHHGQREFVFTLGADMKPTKELLDSLVDELPKKLDHGFLLTFKQEGTPVATVLFSAKGKPIGCYDPHFSVASNNCNFLSPSSLSPLLARPQNAISSYNVELTNEGMFVLDFKKIQEIEGKVKLQDGLLSRKPMHLYLEKEEGSVSEDQVRGLLNKLGGAAEKHQSGFTFLNTVTFLLLFHSQSIR